MYTNILNKQQEQLLPLISLFSTDYFLVGGTAIALFLGHRTSVDFDLFTNLDVKRRKIKNILEKEQAEYTVIHEAYDQFHILITGVKLTFFNFPFKIEHKQNFENHITIPALIDLAAMKAFALGGRAKWKDYVDFYYILKYQFAIFEIEQKAEFYFKDRFNKKLFRQQISYFEDIDYAEPVIYMSENHPSDDDIKSFLIDQATVEF